MIESTTGHVLRDEGEFLIEHNINYPLGAGNGFLMRRCAYSATAPEGLECVGGYDHSATTGKWYAAIHTPLDEENDSDARSVGAYNTPQEAIDALWRHRHEALCRHPSR